MELTSPVPDELVALSARRFRVLPEPDLAGRYGIQSIPTVAVFRDGEPVTGFIGAHPVRVIGGFFDEHVLVDAPEQPVPEGRA